MSGARPDSHSCSVLQPSSLAEGRGSSEVPNSAQGGEETGKRTCKQELKLWLLTRLGFLIGLQNLSASDLSHYTPSCRLFLLPLLLALEGPFEVEQLSGLKWVLRCSCGLNYVSQNKICEVLTSSTFECGLMWKLGLCRYQIKMRSYWTRVGPNPVTSVLIRREELRHRHGHTGTVPCDHRGRETGLDAQASEHRGWPVTPTSWGSQEGSSSEPADRAWPCRHHGFGLLILEL